MKTILRLLAYCTLLTYTPFSYATDANRSYQVGVLQIIDHPSLNEVLKGLRSHLDSSPLKQKVVLQSHNAQGNLVTNAQIAKSLVRKKYDALIGIGTPSAQALLVKNKSTPVLFSPISDPVGAKLVTSWTKPGGLATGTSDKSPVDKQIELILEMQPGIRKIGVLYNASEDNSLTLVAAFKQACKERQVAPAEMAVQNSTMISAAASALAAQGAQAIYIPTDNMLVSAIESVVAAGIRHKVPVYSGEKESVQRGSVASLATNYLRLGQLLGAQLEQILVAGKSPAEIAVASLPLSDFQLVVNKKAAAQMGIPQIPASILQRASEVFN
ncbi:MAG: ABC transporter substrate-binding protein [Zetaproteobacteria bacterium]|nr:ABC transporter substrate-binding protein [Zetaproteobacteria bacterium]